MIKFTGTSLRTIRISYGYTQKRMAELFETKRGTYSSWESKYKNKILPRKTQCKIWTFIKNESAKLRIQELKVKKESLFKRIVKWIMRKK